MALLPNCRPPETSWGLAGGIKSPFEQAGYQDIKTAFELAVFTPAQRLKLLYKMFLAKFLSYV